MLILLLKQTHKNTNKSRTCKLGLSMEEDSKHEPIVKKRRIKETKGGHLCTSWDVGQVLDWAVFSSALASSALCQHHSSTISTPFLPCNNSGGCWFCLLQQLFIFFIFLHLFLSYQPTPLFHSLYPLSVLFYINLNLKQNQIRANNVNY